MTKRKVSLGQEGAPAPRATAQVAVSNEVLELFFGTGVVYHEVALPTPLPDVVSGFKIVEGDDATGYRVRPAEAGEDPDVAISALEHLAELGGRWLPCPYQLSAPLAVQIFLEPNARGTSARCLLAIDTTERAGSNGACLDAALDAGRPFRPLGRGELGRFLDVPDVRQLVRELGRRGMERAPFKLAALLETLAPLLPRLHLSPIDEHVAVPVSLVLDLGNSRSSALLVESHEGRTSSVPLEIRSSGNPFAVSSDAFGSRLAFLPDAFDAEEHLVAVGEGFALPSLVRMGPEALDRALETPHRYTCSLSGPKRYLWDGRPTDTRWHFACRIGGGRSGESYRTIHGRALRHLDDHGDGLVLREDGPSTPADPRYAPRAMMLFALVELLQQAYAQISSAPYKRFQGKEGSPRVLRHVALTYPSAMGPEEREIYESLVQNAVVLACYYLRIPNERRPNWNLQAKRFDRFLVVDEALAAQMVFAYQEIVHRFGGDVDELARVLGREERTLRVGSIDIGGGTSDVMIADYVDTMPGVGTALTVRTLFSDGVGIAGDDVCRALVEDCVVDQMLAQLATPAARRALSLLLAEGDAGHGAQFRTLKAKLVPSFWLPLARCFWAIAEGAEVADHSADKAYGVHEALRAFGQPSLPSSVVAEADAFLSAQVPGWPGLSNFLFRFDETAIDRAVLRILREPLRKYADIIAQFGVDILLLAGRTSKLRAVRRVMLEELPVAPARIVAMAGYPVADWYPSRWRNEGKVLDPKTTVAAGATVLHLALRNQLPGLVIESVAHEPVRPIFGLYQDAEPHIPRSTELFGEKTLSSSGAASRAALSEPFLYVRGMRLGARYVASEEMDGAPLFEVCPRDAATEEALLAARARVRFRLAEGDRIEIAEVIANERGGQMFSPGDLVLRLRTSSFDRYWLDTGELEVGHRWLDAARENG